ncbi:sigma-70 family RNA polymerase sigma factor [Lusitaniella coriacea LEGE 07157]|uniref:Sigma-70 family RNA polymerase sigma factor n=1 Tax=Lusitaniella coriacea LEGE 07157 TaxID=945747 RepID=A0A8J7B8G2_9CYAN|nr:sigma-70 family RNA polymerase sigma factor [Lusitaniella coriacea]MBE9114463.1 sigma-70 family RNA polymerase sigma factor [Lusitaniella coriacea LEGE 07157]
MDDLDRKKTLCELEQFARNAILDSNKDIHLILPFIKFQLYRFRLYPQYDVHEVFTEAYCRARNCIRFCEEERFRKLSENIPGWFKATIFNIVREYKKNCQSYSNCAEKAKNLSDTTIPDLEIDNYSNPENLERLKEGLTALRPEDRSILYLRFVMEWSWKEIGDDLLRCGFFPDRQNDSGFWAFLRKRGERTLNRLRRNFFSEQLLATTHLSEH